MHRQLFRLVKVQWKMLKNLRGDRRAIARGVALGVAMNFIPTLGLGVPIVFWLGGIIRSHKSAAVVSTIGFKPLLPILYILNYIIGSWILFYLSTPDLVWHGASHAGLSFFVGMAINFTITFIAIYYLTLHWINKRKQKTLSRRC